MVQDFKNRKRKKEKQYKCCSDKLSASEVELEAMNTFNSGERKRNALYVFEGVEGFGILQDHFPSEKGKREKG